jgi:hypothetical protein
MLRDRNKSKRKPDRSKDTTAKEVVKPLKPNCRCGGSGWIREVIPASAFRPQTYVKKRCSCSM